jgi:putative restriction endonuclease
VVKGVFDTKPGSGYDDRLEARYHFPARSNYLSVAHALIGDWIVYREPQRNNGRRAYIGTARVVGVEPDTKRPDHAYAYLQDYFAFDPPIPFGGATTGTYWEAPLRAVADPSRVGQSLQGKSMRLLAESDFAAIVSAALVETLTPKNLVRYGPGVEEGPTPLPAPPLAGYPDLPGADFVRRVEQTLLNRKVRDANFRRLICQAYDDTCAVTGLRIVNGGGRSEVQAAHIWSVEKGGPDVVQNGLALSGTAHWLFDRHLISLTDDYRLLVSHNKVPAELRGLFQQQMNQIRLPGDPAHWPHPTYIRRHREAYMAA